ncbi:MAG: biotin--[acetyl-CoA-carboxylase] ligase [Ignavibacterium sp.]
MDSINFSIEKFDIKLDTDWIGRNFILIDEVDSTNTFLIENKEISKVNGTVVLSEKQNKGKGRFERQWYSSKGLNLTFSILLIINKKLKNKLNFINLGTAVVIANSIENLYQLNVNLKWPNDVLIKNKKIAGILIETSSQNDKIDDAVVGIGLNVNQTSFQGDFKNEPTSIKLEFGQIVEREKLLAEILNNFEFMINEVKNNNNFILKEWREKCNMIGDKISIQQNDKIIDGIFYDIDENGFLLLKTGNDILTISSGDVTIL